MFNDSSLFYDSLIRILLVIYDLTFAKEDEDSHLSWFSDTDIDLSPELLR